MGSYLSGRYICNKHSFPKNNFILENMLRFLAFTYTYVAALRCGAPTLQDVEEEEEDGGKHGLEENIKLTEGSEF